MSEYVMRLAVREKVEREIIGHSLYGFPLDEVVNRIEQILRDDIEMIDDDSDGEETGMLEFHPPQTMGDR